ncbi:Parvalbumin [Parasponia andersonii]|uniref:Parvalbumin n=1 Tax=Parasponia andersonii TaxID=3476 RepID=A0A2P5AJV0_PARAD|nr:Parvalbumin [Parasponia andersonii]
MEMMNALLFHYIRACTEAYIHILPLVIISFVIIILGEFYSNLRYVLKLFLHLLCSTQKYYEKHSLSRKQVDNTEAPKKKLIKTKYAAAAHDDDQVLLTRTQNKRGRSQPKKVDDNKLCLGYVKGVMEKLVQENETTMFEEEAEEEEVSLEELREAFDLFDENNDGFIDAREVQRALSELGFMEASEAECEAMIRTFDKDRDERIDFEEFIEMIAADSFH